jgi:cbb3-type cytochrome oxidase subunit 3
MKNKIKNFILSIDLSLIGIVYVAIVWAFYDFGGIKIPNIVTYVVTLVFFIVFLAQIIWFDAENKK